MEPKERNRCFITYEINTKVIVFRNAEKHITSLIGCGPWEKKPRSLRGSLFEVI